MARIIGVDVGGTFTDIAVFEDGAMTGHKVPTTIEQSEGVAAALEWRDDDLFLHGTTAATNALLEERGAVVALVTGAGFEDLVEIARQDRPSLYDPAVDRPAPLVTRSARVGHDGDVGATVGRLAELEPAVVVVGLVEGYRDPDEERDLAAAIRERLEMPVIEATTISPEFREYERIATSLLSAYLTPSVAGYLGALGERLTVSRRLVMTSAGGLLPFDQGAANAARLVLSGPAGGVVAAAALGAHHGHPSVISFDMGGTSTDVCRISGGVPAVGSGHRVAGRVNRVPSVPVRTIGAGGGSVGWLDPGGALRVGPRSAGAAPGPAACGQGGVEATVTDANLMLGHIPADLALGGRLLLDPRLAEEALARLAEIAGLSPRGTAQGMIEIVDSHMEHALRAVTVEEGVDPRDSVLVAFGGAGGLHAGRLARSLQIPKVLVPPLSGVLSAVGLLLASPRADATRTVLMADGDPQLDRHVSTVVEEARRKYADLFGHPALGAGVGFDCRYAGQSHELEVDAAPSWPSIRAGFEEAHLRQFGFVRPGEPVEVVNVRAVAIGDPPLRWEQVMPDLPRGEAVGRGGVWQRATLPAGFETMGPGVIVEDSSAVLLEAGDRLVVLLDGTLEITHD
ncbi:MAG: hydantoinase/oxoprolinase family protein [Acidimicrobiia bacterium]